MDVSAPRRLSAPTVDRRNGRPAHRGWALAMAASWAAVALITLTPRGSGWAWGSPLTEARWYLTGLDSPATMLQLAGNLLLLVVPAGLAAARWPVLGRVRLLAALSLAAGSTIEFLQWALPLGRVVSPMDAVLNATGALAAGLTVAHVRALRVLPQQYATTPSGRTTGTPELARLGGVRTESRTVPPPRWPPRGSSSAAAGLAGSTSGDGRATTPAVAGEACAETTRNDRWGSTL